MAFFGKNTPPEKIDEMKKYVEQTEKEVGEFIKIPCESEEVYAQAGIIGKKITTLSKDVESARNDDKEPFIEAGKQVDREYGVIRNPYPNSLQDRLSKAKKKIIEHAEPYARALLQAEEERKRKLAEEARIQAEEARKKQEEADRLLQESRTKEQAEKWRAAEMEAQNWQALANKKELQARKAKPISQGISGHKMRYVTRRTAEIVDWESALAAYSGNEKVKNLIQQLADADARSNVAVNGVIIHEEQVLQSA